MHKPVGIARQVSTACGEMVMGDNSGRAVGTLVATRLVVWVFLYVNRN
jgi:hypothetical protein